MTTLKSDLLEGATLEVVAENDDFYASMATDVSPFLALDDIPNYFIFNRQTAKIEGMSHSLAAAKAFLDFLADGGGIEGSDIIKPNTTVSH